MKIEQKSGILYTSARESLITRISSLRRLQQLEGRNFQGFELEAWKDLQKLQDEMDLENVREDLNTLQCEKD